MKTERGQQVSTEGSFYYDQILGLESTDNHSVWGIVCIFDTQSFILLRSYLQLRTTSTCNNFCTMTLFVCYINTLLISTLFLKLKHAAKNVVLLSAKKTKVWNALFSFLFNKCYHRKFHSPNDFFSKDFRNRSIKETWRNCTIVTLFWLWLLAFIQYSQRFYYAIFSNTGSCRPSFCLLKDIYSKTSWIAVF